MLLCAQPDLPLCSAGVLGSAHLHGRRNDAREVVRAHPARLTHASREVLQRSFCAHSTPARSERVFPCKRSGVESIGKMVLWLYLLIEIILTFVCFACFVWMAYKEAPWCAACD